MNPHPVEALLRPAVELWSALAAFTAAAVAWLAPWALMMPPGVARGTACALAGFAAWRARQAWRVLRYRRGLRRLRTWRLAPGRLPVSPRKLFIGRGFRWTALHTQRLRDTLRPEVRRYVQPGALHQWARRREIDWESRPGLGRLAGLLCKCCGGSPLSPGAGAGGNPALHAVEPREQAVWMDLGVVPSTSV